MGSLGGVISALQAEDEEQHDAACETALADGVTIRHGARLATDGCRRSERPEGVHAHLRVTGLAPVLWWAAARDECG